MTNTLVDLQDRDIRQRDIIPAAKLSGMTCVIIGVGAIGRQVAMQLATIGVPRLYLLDPDTVSVENLAAQGFREADLGKPKVFAVKDACLEANSGIKIVADRGKFACNKRIPAIDKKEVRAIFCCVDSMTARKDIWAALGNEPFFVDTRMGAEVARVLCTHDKDPVAAKHYPTTLFDESRAFVATCTAKTTFYCASLCAALAVSQLTKYLRDVPIDKDITFNILACELNRA
jgi:sulfur carrier protein ThiS adenylyltransferase